MRLSCSSCEDFRLRFQNVRRSSIRRRVKGTDTLFHFGETIIYAKGGDILMELEAKLPTILRKGEGDPFHLILKKGAT